VQEAAMQMTQILLAVCIPTLTVLVGILLNRSDFSKLDARIGAVENRLDSRMNALEARFHTDMMMVIGKLTELEVRVAKLETQRQ
jgi:hypothetical protein